MESLASSGDRRAARLRERLRDLSFELSGAQLGITATSLVLGAVAEPTVARMISPVLARVGVDSANVAIGLALALATVFQMIVGELFPKNFAIARAYPVAVTVGLPMSWLNRLLRPVIQFFNRSANWAVRRLGIEPRDELAGLRSLQELEMIVRASSEEGELDPTETTLLTRAIAFVDRHAADVMIPRVSVHGVPRDATIAELRDLARRTGHSRFPVYEGDLDQVTGIAHVKDTFKIPRDRHEEVTVAAITTPVEFVPESMRLASLLLALQRSRRSIAVVVDEYGGTAGIVTVEDIVEEILGEIEDEHDFAVTSRGGPGIVAGSLHRHEVEELTGFQWPEGAYETLSGYVTARLDRFPRVGDVLEEGRYRIEVLGVRGRVATRLRIVEMEEAEE
nr:HlyC/CorC family transporter [Acidimicrobiia bacterium]